MNIDIASERAIQVGVRPALFAPSRSPDPELPRTRAQHRLCSSPTHKPRCS